MAGRNSRLLGGLKGRAREGFLGLVLRIVTDTRKTESAETYAFGLTLNPYRVTPSCV